MNVDEEVKCMGRIIAEVNISNALESKHSLTCDVLIDTGTSSLVLPKSWKRKLGPLASSRSVSMETADPRVITGEVCGPVKIQIKGFDPVFNEVTFIDMEPSEGCYEPLLGYIILEQSRAAIDMSSHLLTHVKTMDLKSLVDRAGLEPTTH